MKENYLLAYECVKTAKETFYGILTYSEFQLICEKYQLTSEQANKLNAQLVSEGICLVADEEKADIENRTNKNCKNVKREEAKNGICREVSNETIEEWAKQVIAKRQLTKKQFTESELVNLVHNIRNEVKRVGTAQAKRYESHEIIAVALVAMGIKASMEILEKKGKRGRVCGTYASRVEKRLAEDLKSQYSKEKLDLLLEYCKSDKVSDYIMDLLLICLIEHIKPIGVHISYDEFLD